MNGDQVRLWRWDHQITQESLAEHLHVTAKTIKCWEGGTHVPPDYLRLALERLGELLGDGRLLEETHT
jgi:DNA-binding transcriptional regulator YiaG